MRDFHQRLRVYYTTGNYRGFYKVTEHQMRLAGRTFMKFSNGKKEIYSTGLFIEGVLESIFDQIDEYYANKESIFQAM
ncbi:hypothetical protein SAMN06265218_11814 [Fodinibius sediminis]|uniref:Uncharacterized protein n=1 Tax=Fodinibius sediminis TaxID=1214077 RepID=A0A521EQ84_9BACT|nr:hypothetical protein SAMN06265218_11814 [Fodinibius sediminis]